MAFSSSNDFNILQAGDAATVIDAGAGDDTYIISGSLTTGGRTYNINDTSGAVGSNKIQLVGGLTVTSSLVTSNAIQLTLSNGAIININGANTFGFVIGGDPLNGVAGTAQDFATFAVTTLGAAAVPAAGAAAVAGTPNKVIATGGVGPVLGQTFTLTNSIDVLTGTAGDDTFIAGTQANLSTLTAGDQINGGAGIDKLDLYGNSGLAAFATSNITNVEVVTALFDATSGSLNVSGNAGVTGANIGTSTVTNAAGSGAVAITLTKAQAAGITGTILNDTPTSLVGNNVAVTIAFSDVAGGADTATLNLNNAKLALNSANVAGTGNGVTLAGVETLNIAAAGTNALGNFDTAQTTKMVITGAGSLSATLSTAAGLTKTIDGSAATGNLVINNSAAAAAVQSIKTGTGNDVYVTKYADLTSDDSIDMGAGTDSLRFVDAATFTTTVQKALLSKVVGVEGLGTINAALTVDGDFVTQTIYSTSGASGQAVLTNVANAAQLQFGTGAILASSVAMKLGASALNVSLTGSAAAASDLTLGLTVTGSSTINVTSAGVDGSANNVLALTTADNQSIVVTGSQNLTLTAVNAGAVTGDTIDGSAFTGKLTVTGTASTDIVKGGSGNDIISGGAGAAVADTLTGGAGSDKFIIISGATSTTFDTITDFATGADSIKFTQALPGTTGNFLKGAAPVADFTAALAAANAVFAADLTTGYSVQQVGADSYVFSSAPATAVAAEVVKLTGVALTGVAFGDIVA